MNIPDNCYALNNMTINPTTKRGKVIEIRAFETGYYKTDWLMTQEEVDEKNNSELGVSPTQAKAMESASLFGWQCYKSCLESYENNG